MSKLNIIAAGAAAVAIAVSGWTAAAGGRLNESLSNLRGDLKAHEAATTPPSEFEAAHAEAADIRKNPADLPAPLTRTEAQKVVLNLETVELDGKLADGTTYTYWTFNKTVPGPMLRVREGDTVELHLKNAATSKSIHSIDLHAVSGPGGGAASTQVKPGETKVFSFKALNPGAYVYHCASPHIPTHIAQGMYGMILVEPKAGLAPADREFYVMQGEVYAAGRAANHGHQPFDGDLLFNEKPNYVVFNGAFQALTGDRSMKAKAGERIRIFVGNGGPNLVSSFHVIGEVFDQVHEEGATEAVSNLQTTLIPAGGAAWVELTVDVPGRYMLVDHSISRAIDKGAVAYLEVEGQPNSEIYHDPNGHPMPGSGGH
ncbi:MAG TPA: copper-containing nitrite reductase [Symbiobacteriaceae bacterium]|nr:copper-containing nitrite reductase [Symbiobacteriaceae bacterium]